MCVGGGCKCIFECVKWRFVLSLSPSLPACFTWNPCGCNVDVRLPRLRLSFFNFLFSCCFFRHDETFELVGLFFSPPPLSSVAVCKTRLQWEGWVWYSWPWAALVFHWDSHMQIHSPFSFSEGIISAAFLSFLPLLSEKGKVIYLFVSLCTCGGIFKCLKMHVSVSLCISVHVCCKTRCNKCLSRDIRLLCASSLFRGESGGEVHFIRVNTEKSVLFVDYQVLFLSQPW